MDEEKMVSMDRFNEVYEERRKIEEEKEQLENELNGLRSFSEENERLKQEIIKLRIDNAADKILYEAGAINNATVKPLLNLSEILSEDDNLRVELIKEQVEKLATEKSTAFLFKSAHKPHFTGATPDEGRDGLPSVNYSDCLGTAIAKHIFK